MYRIQLEQFEGPLDLLLFFIRRDELDIHDIPVARITDEFLAYVRMMERVDLDGVGEFVYMAALLIRLKARMLLPEPPTDEEGEPVDPRRELVERLLEYVRFKEAAGQLDRHRARRAERFTRGLPAAEQEVFEEAEDPEVDATVYDLIRVLGDLLAETPDEEEPVHEVERIEYTVEEQQRYVLEQIASGKSLAFRALVRTATASFRSDVQAKAFVIATFLAVLELARQRYVRVARDEESGAFAITRCAPPAGIGAAGPVDLSENGAGTS